MRVEILGSGGAVTIPRPGCSCAVCIEAREKGVPYSRSGPSVFIHGPDILIDTPEESKDQINRAGIMDINAGLYSHWHPDHTAGRRMWETRNFEFRSWPKRAITTPIYVPESAWADFEKWYGIADQFRWLEGQGSVEIHRMVDHVPITISGATVTPIALVHENAHAFLIEFEAKRVLIAMDETHYWEPGDLGPLDLAVLPLGVFPFHPWTGERKMPEEFTKGPARKTRYEQTLVHIEQLQARQTVLIHIEEMEGLNHDELVRLGERDGWTIGFAGQTVEV